MDNLSKRSELRAVFVPPFYGINIRVDNRVRRGKVMPDKKLKGFMKCNQETYNWLKNHPGMKKYNFSQTSGQKKI